MARCGCSGNALCFCVVQAGDNVTVTGTGNAGSPYIISAATTPITVSDTDTIDLTLVGNDVSGIVKLNPSATNLISSTPTGLLLNCAAIVAGCPALAPVTVAVQDTPTLNLTISAGPNYVISGVVTPACADVRACISDLPGIIFNGTTGTIAPEISAVAGNTLVVQPDGLFAPAAASSPAVVGCGILGDGTALDPLTANTPTTWPFACTQSANQAPVYCDPVTGALGTDPRPRSLVAGANDIQSFTPIAMPLVSTPIATMTVLLTNPSPCLSMNYIATFEFFVTFDITSGDVVRVLTNTELMLRHDNGVGSSGQNDETVRLTYTQRGTLAPGAVAVPLSRTINVFSDDTSSTYSAYRWRINVLGVTDNP